MECSHCKKTFKSARALKYHTDNRVCHKTKKAHECDLCNHVFSTKQKLEQHMSGGVYRKTYSEWECTYCEKQFASKQKLQQHEKNKTCQKDDCRLCGRSTKDPWHKKHCTDKIYGPQKVTAAGLMHQKYMLRDYLHLFPVPWEDRTYWNGLCEAGHKRSSMTHMRNCLKKS